MTKKYIVDLDEGEKVELVALTRPDSLSFQAAQGSFSQELAAAAKRAGMIPSTMVVYIKK